MRLTVRLKTILLATAMVAVSFFVSLKTMDWLSPRGARLRGQGRQPGVADSAKCRYRLERVARRDHGDRRPGCAVAGYSADGSAECNGLAVIEGDRRGQ